MTLFETVRSWVTDEAEHYTYAHFPEMNAEVDPLIPYGSYFRLTLAQIFLRNDREWFTDIYPAAHTSVRLQHANNDAVELTHVTHVPGQNVAKGIDLNHTVTGLIPYNGGTLEIDCGLLGIKGKDYLDASIKMLGSFSDLVAAPMNQAITIAGKVATSVRDLFQDGQGKVTLNYGNTFAERNPPRPGHYAAVLATKAQLGRIKLSVEKDRLMGNGEPLTGFDYLLFRLDSVKERKDWRMRDIQSNLTAAKKAYMRKRDDEGDEYRAAALVAVYDSADLSEVDRARVEQVIRDELESFRQPGRGAVSDGQIENQTLEALMAKAPSWGEAAAELAKSKPLLRQRLSASSAPVRDAGGLVAESPQASVRV
jgi:hypothetical protein